MITIKRLLLNWNKILIIFFAIIGWISAVVTIAVAFGIDFLKYWKIWLFWVLLCSISISLKINWPKNYFEFKLKNKDVYIWIKIWDIFKSKWSIIIPVNNTFDVSQNWHISKAKSVLNTFIEFYYDWKIEHLQQDINSKILKNKDKYDMWETIEIDKKNKKFYLVVNSKVNWNNRSQSTKDDFSQTLTYLFDYLSSNADKDEIINIPLINSWYWRISDLNRNAIIKEIVHFFIDSTKSKVMCDKLIIHIFPDDIKKWWIKIDELRLFLEYNANNYRDINYNPTPEWTQIE